LLPGLPIPFAVMIGSYALATGSLSCSKSVKAKGHVRLHVRPCERHIHRLPVNLLLFGDESLPFALLYYIAKHELFWTFASTA